MKSKSVVLMIVSLGFGLIAAIGISQVMGNSGPAEVAVERGQVLVAAADLKHGDSLNEETVKIEHWPVEVIPEDAARDMEQVKHMKMTTRLSKSLPIMMGDTLNESEIDNVSIPKGFKLVAIKVSAEDTLTGLLQPGDKVDVIGVVTVRNQDPNSKARTQIVSETFLKNIEVFTIDGKLRNDGIREAGGNGNAIVGVLVTEKQSELIVLVQKVAKLRLVLRGKTEDTDNDGDEITDYSGFYESVFGKAGEEAGTGDIGPQDTYTTKVYNPDGYQEVKFVNGNRVTPQQAELIQERDDDSEDYDRNEEIESGLEEDQYPGE